MRQSASQCFGYLHFGLLSQFVGELTIASPLRRSDFSIVFGSNTNQFGSKVITASLRLHRFIFSLYGKQFFIELRLL